MKITLILTGKTDDSFLIAGIKEYQKRIERYVDFNIIEITSLKNTKNLSKSEYKRKEAEIILKKLTEKDFVVLLDERGKEYSSIEFAAFIKKSQRSITFIVGGAYGFDEQVYKRANAQISLSKMTFTHQMIRLIFVEQLYRAMTINNNEPYHHS